MSSGTSERIRLVKCPKCFQVLPESPNVPVYQCGGCGAFLKAKNAASSASGLPETNAPVTNNLDHVSAEKESSSAGHEANLHSAQECSMVQENERDQKDAYSCNGDKFPGLNLPSMDQKDGSKQNECEDFNNQRPEDVNLLNDNQDSAGDPMKSLACDNEPEVRGLNLSSEHLNNCNQRDRSSTCSAEQLRVLNENYSSYGFANIASEKLSTSPIAGAFSEAEVNDESSQLAAMVEAETDADHPNNSTLRRLSQGEVILTEGSTSFATAHLLPGESISSDIFVSSHTELPEQPQESSQNAVGHVGPADTFAASDFVHPSSELSGALIDLSKSPTTRSSRAYYNDGVSSDEGNNGQLPDRHKHSSRHAYRLANHVASDGRPKRERSQANSNYEVQYHFKNSASILPGKTHCSRKSRNLDRDEWLEPTRPNHLARNWRRAERGEYSSQHLLHQRQPLAGYASSSPASQPQDYFYRNESFASQDMSAYTDQEKMELVRMMYELQEQLKSSSLSCKANGGFARKDDQIPMYYDRKVLQRLHDLDSPRYSGRLRNETILPQHRKHSRIPFSAEATTGRQQIDNSLCCCPEGWQLSAQLPLPPLRHNHNKGFCHIHSRLNHYNPYGSCPTSPHRHLDHEFSTYRRGTKSDDRRHIDLEVKKQLREKLHLAKRHVRPIAGGAPLITCPYCLKQLQLPADFLLFKRRFHRLTCGACLEVLKYSLVDRTHLIPYISNAEAPPPSEVEEHNDATHRRNFTSTSHVSDCPCADSDDFTDKDPVPHAAERFYVSHSSHEHGKERKRVVLNHGQSKGKNPVEAYESASAGPSSNKWNPKKAASEIEELPAPARGGGGSPLHRLMGYSSPRAVIFGFGPSDPGPSSFQQT